MMLVHSTVGGETFGPPVTVADGITDLEAVFPKTGVRSLWSHFPAATFRIVTCPTCCVAGSDTVLVAWADARENVGGAPVSRVYYRRSDDKGATWAGPPSGQPLLGPGNTPADAVHDFHPQIVAMPNGVVGCAWYRFRPAVVQEAGGNIDVMFAFSTDGGKSFGAPTRVTDAPWDPAVNAPWAHGDSKVTFIGEYFGMDANADGFHVLWTDTRTGMQELFYSRLVIQDRYDIDGAVGGVLVGGVAVDGGGWVILPGGHVVPIPPQGPLEELATHLGRYSVAASLRTPADHAAAQREALHGLIQAANAELKRLGGD
jgi:hypothetical protein